MIGPPPTGMTSTRSSQSPRGFTLVELIVATAIMGILMTGLASAVLIATHALPDDESPSRAASESATVADQLAEELASAVWIIEHTPTAVTFTVADRDNDGAAERIRYAWSGTAGDPLTRQYNGGTVLDMLADVHEFDLAYTVQLVTEEYPGPVIEGAEQELSSHGSQWEDWGSFPIKDKEWPGQYFEPSLPADAVSWRATRVWLYVRSEAAVEQTLVQIRPADANRKPTDTVLAEEVMDEADLEDYYAWHEVPFTNAGGLSPDQAFCLVLKNGSGGGVSARIGYDDGGGSGGVNTKDGGKSWTYYDWLARFYYVYGAASTPGPPQTATRSYVTGVGITVRTGENPAARVVTSAHTLNNPELLSGLWKAYFDKNPTLDHNGDGVGDWTVFGGGSFDNGSLSGGVWAADTRLDTSPTSNFTGLTTVNVRFRDTSADLFGVAFLIHADWSGSNCATLMALCHLQADNTQTVTLYHNTSTTVQRSLATVAGLSKDFVNLRLLIDPDLDTVNLQVNDEDRGTFAYATCVPITSEHTAMVLATGGTAEVDEVSVRVSE
jgi:prepilin-type N-terminal cleavage/methylation domain-containing protein